MKNSKELCQSLCLPFSCIEVESGRTVFPREPQSHCYAEMYVMREGRLRVVLEDLEHVLIPGEAAFFCPGVQHRVALDNEDPVKMDVLRMDPDRMPEFPPYSPGLKVILQEARRTDMPMIIPARDAAKMNLPELSARCVLEQENLPYGYDMDISCRLSMMLLALTRFWQEKGMKIQNRESGMDPIYTLSGYIQSHLKSGLRVEDLASRCGLSYPWFAKKFREIYGISCKDYIEQIRVARVEQYLMFTDMDLSMISEETGYADCSHMIKNFKRIKNITPGQYRLQKK